MGFRVLGLKIVGFWGLNSGYENLGPSGFNLNPPKLYEVGGIRTSRQSLLRSCVP